MRCGDPASMRIEARPRECLHLSTAFHTSRMDHISKQNTIISFETVQASLTTGGQLGSHHTTVNTYILGSACDRVSIQDIDPMGASDATTHSIKLVCSNLQGLAAS